MSVWLFSSSSLPLADVLSAFARSNPAGKIIVAFLFFGSIAVWSLMATKFRELIVVRRASRRFLRLYRQQRRPTALYGDRRAPEGNPLGILYDGVCETLAAGRSDAAGGPRWNAARLNAVRNAADRAAAEQILRLEENMSLLATATTAAPFLGLLGTVWGVMEAFMGMGETALLSAVAPGISGALLTTVVGLLVALPSAIGYNTLSAWIRHLSVMIDNFSGELIADLETFAAEEGDG